MIDSWEKMSGFLGKKTFLAGDEVCFVDIIAMEMIEYTNGLAQDERVFDKYPNLQPYLARMHALPKVAAWRASDKFVAEPFLHPVFPKVKF